MRGLFVCCVCVCFIVMRCSIVHSSTASQDSSQTPRRKPKGVSSHEASSLAILTPHRVAPGRTGATFPRLCAVNRQSLPTRSFCASKGCQPKQARIGGYAACHVDNIRRLVPPFSSYAADPPYTSLSESMSPYVEH